MKRKVYIQNHFFCRTRTLDVIRIQYYLEVNGYSIVDNPELSDYILVSTCGVQDTVAQKSIEQIIELKQYSNAELIVIGCLPDTDRELLDKVFNGKFIRNVELFQLDKFFNVTVPFSEFENIQFNITNGEFYIEIVRGCSDRCSYCAIWKAIKVVKSLDIEICKLLIENAIREKAERIVLGADNLGIYGYDIDSDIGQLLRSIKFPQHSRIVRLNNLHPRDLIKYSDTILQLVREGVIGLLKIPIQSASQSVVDVMRRKYDIEALGKLINEIKSIDNSVIIMTDIIVGFPGETPEDLNLTIDYIAKHIDIGRVHVFSPKSKTEASRLPDNLTQDEKEKRLKVLLNALESQGFVNRINDDFVNTFSKQEEAFDKNNPYTKGITNLFIRVNR